MAIRELSSLEKYLGLKKAHKFTTQGDNKVPVLQSSNGPPLVGLLTVASHLVKEAKRPELLGDSAEGRAVVQQWLEYRVTRLEGGSREDVRTALNELNAYLGDKAYFSGTRFTLADIILYYGLHSVMVDMSVQEREQFVNVTRWFDHIQHVPGVRHHLPPVALLRNRIYTSRHH